MEATAESGRSFLGENQECHMANLKLSVPNISCRHCVHTIGREVGALAGVKSVSADVDTKSVQVEYAAPATEAQIRTLLIEIGYPPAES